MNTTKLRVNVSVRGMIYLSKVDAETMCFTGEDLTVPDASKPTGRRVRYFATIEDAEKTAALWNGPGRFVVCSTDDAPHGFFWKAA